MSEYPTLTPDQETALVTPLEPRMVRKDPNRNSYIPAWYVRKRLNEVFGPGRWSTTTLHCELVAESSGMRRKRDKKGVEYGDPYEAWTVLYTAQVRLEVRDRVTNAVIGHWDDGAIGAQQGVPNRADAHDGAMKSALSGALKRCAVNPGIGLSLYDNGSLGWDDHVDAGESTAEQAAELREQIRLLATDLSLPLADVASWYLRDFGEDIRQASPEPLTTFLASLRSRAKSPEPTNAAGAEPQGEGGEAPAVTPGEGSRDLSPGTPRHEFRAAADRSGTCRIDGCGRPPSDPVHVEPDAQFFRDSLLAPDVDKAEVKRLMRQLEMKSLGEEQVADESGVSVLLRDLAAKRLKEATA